MKSLLKGRILNFSFFALFVLMLAPPAQTQTCTSIDYNRSTIAAGTLHTVGLKEDGTVVAVGANWAGQTNVSSWTSIKAIAAEDNHTVGLKENGTVVAVGYNWLGQLNVSSWTGIKAIATGTYHTVGIKEDGAVVAVGAVGSYYDYGQTNVSSWTGIKAIAAGHGHTVGLKEDGTVVAVGDNWLGQTDVSSWTDIKAIATGSNHTIGLKEDGTVVAVGPNWGQLDVSSWTGIRAIAAGTFHTVGLKEDGTVVAVGRNDYGQLNVSLWTGIKAIAAAYGHTVGLKEDGTVVAVGANGGQLNTFDWSNIRQPACLDYNPPVANAGPDQIIECAGSFGAYVPLDGYSSSDPNNDPLIFIWTWDGGSAEGINPTILLPLGTTAVILTVSNGNVSATDTVSITVQDTTPPATTATGSSENWYNANVISTFTASDSCSGVKEIHYSIDGYETIVSGDWASVLIGTEGIHNIVYYAVDNAGNAESLKSLTIKIDKTPPTINLYATPDTIWPPNHEMVDVTVGGGASDALSGVASLTFTVTDEYGTVQPSINAFDTAIPLEAWREGSDDDGRHYTITAVATDAAGNSSTKSTVVLVPHDQR